MTIFRWTPKTFGLRDRLPELDQIRNRLEGLYDSMAESVDSFRRGGAGVFPLINVSEDNENLYVAAELPGVGVADLDVSVHGDNLTIRGERKIAEIDREINVHRREREAGYFRRIVALPVKVDVEKVSAMVHNGMLEITLPKASEAKPHRVSITAD